MIRHKAAFLATLCILALARGVGAQTVSPGPLSTPHANLEGIKNCTQCHEMGQRVIDANRCLACHTPLKSRIQAKQGFHSSKDVAGKPCEGCHHEHAGRDLPLVSWNGPQSAFDHGPTGWALEGAHRKLTCGSCHDPERIRDPEVRAYITRSPGARPFLGLDNACASCHFDEHRGQLPADCASCHGNDAWTPAPRFDHDKAAYPLRGSHAKVECAKCHPSVVDPAHKSDASPRPRAATYMKAKPIDHAECSACHKDPHAGRLGVGCASCHTVDGWTQIAKKGTGSAFDHDKTRFPLAGRHQEVPCAGCHPGWSSIAGSTPARPKLGEILTGFAFAKCSDCHEDAHAGQISLPDSLGHATTEGGGATDCARCHTVDGFTPARFTHADHGRTRYPLQRGHEAVPCVACHPADSTLQKSGWTRPPRVFKADPSRLSYGDRDLEECATCHHDPHAGQFARADDAAHPARKCADCHRATSFHDLAFDHGRDTMYPLRGKHAKAACSACHPLEDATSAPQESLAPWFKGVQGAGTIRTSRYRGTPSSCETCHADAHLGQFASAISGASGASGTSAVSGVSGASGASGNGAKPCSDCHTEDAFSPASRFDHGKTRFVLTGAHTGVKCPECHRNVSVIPGLATALYRPMPTLCSGCHEDPHGGAYETTGVPSSCESCHVDRAWQDVHFDHDRTGFPLGPAHAGVACASCHPAGRKVPPSRDCASCHTDPHGGVLSAACGNCHLDASSFRDASAARFHERTRLPLLGRHAAIPCESCHLDRSSATWAGLDPRCVSCHQADYDRTSAAGLDHRAWGFPTRCEECHGSVRWDVVSFPSHERCFPIRSGHHSVPCLDCHTSLPSQPTTGCATMTAACTRCHSCEHRSVPGFECRDRKCYECHPTGGGE